MTDLRSLAPNAEYATETREELLYNKEKLLSNGMSATLFSTTEEANTPKCSDENRHWPSHFQFQIDIDNSLAIVFNLPEFYGC